MPLDEVTIRKKLQLLLEDDKLVETYLEKHGATIDLQKLKELKQTGKKKKDWNTGPGDDPLYIIKVKCPVCKKTDIFCYELRAKSQAITYDRFTVPRYAGTKGFRTVNFSEFAVTVCPRCLFASPDKRDFITISVQSRTENKSRITNNVLTQLQDKIALRRNLVGTSLDMEEYFSPPRTTEAAIASYRLAIQRAQVEAEFGLPNAWYKSGMYCLKIAMLERDREKDDEEVLRQAVEFLEKSFQQSEITHPETEYQITYIIAAIHLRMQNTEKFQAYLTAMEKIKTDMTIKAKSDPSIKLQGIEQWVRKTKDLYADRAVPELWKH